MLIQKSMGVDTPLFQLSFFFSFSPLGLRQTSENIEGVMKKTNAENSLHILSAKSMTLYFSSLLQSTF